jgi:antigen flippase
MMQRMFSTVGLMAQGILSGRRSLHGLLQGLLSQVLVQALNVLTGIIAARLLGPEGRGAFVVMTLWPQLLGVLLVAGLPVATTYHLRHHPEETAKAAGALAVLGTIAVIVGGLIGQFLIPVVLSHWPADVVTASQTLVWFIFINIFTLLLRPCFLARGDFWTYNSLFFGPPAAYLVFLVGTHLTVGLTALNASICLLVSGLPVLAWGVIKLIATTGISFSMLRVWLGRLGNFAAGACSADILVGLFNYADRLLLAKLVSAAELGLYVVAYSVARLIMLVSSSVSAVLLRSMSGSETDRIWMLYDYSIRFGFWTLMAMALPLIFFGQYAITIVFGAEFAPAVPVFRILVMDSVVTCLTQIASQSLMAVHRPKIVSMAEAAGTSVALIMLVALTSLFGLEGTAAAVLMGSLTRASVVFGTVHGRFGVNLPRLLIRRADLVFVMDRLR